MKWERLPSRALDAALQRGTQWLGQGRLRAAGVELGDNVSLMGVPIVSRSGGSRIVIERDVLLCSASRWTALGIAHAVVLRTMTPQARLRIGRGTGISGGSFCAAVSIDIGERCVIGADVTVADTDFHPLAPANRMHAPWREVASAAVRIGNDVFIGAGAVVLKGVDIGDGAVIGAGSVVTRSVPAMHVAAGNPASVLRRLPAADL